MIPVHTDNEQMVRRKCHEKCRQL